MRRHCEYVDTEPSRLSSFRSVRKHRSVCESVCLSIVCVGGVGFFPCEQALGANYFTRESNADYDCVYAGGQCFHRMGPRSQVQTVLLLRNPYSIQGVTQVSRSVYTSIPTLPVLPTLHRYTNSSTLLIVAYYTRAASLLIAVCCIRRRDCPYHFIRLASVQAPDYVSTARDSLTPVRPE